MICRNFDTISVPTCGICSSHSDCVKAMFAKLTPENQKKVNDRIEVMIEEQMKAARSAANTQDGGAEQTANPVTASILTDNKGEFK